MQVIVKSLVVIVLLASCGTAEQSRYRDTEALERPPIVVSSPSREQRTEDTSSIPKRKDSTGLGSDVYLNGASQLTIRQPVDDAWNTLGRALKQSGIKVTDHEQDKGQYYVTQETDEDNSGFFAKASSFFGDDPAIYLLTVKSEGEQTTVTASLANATEQSSAAKDGTANPSAEGAEDLLQRLFKTLHDTLEEE